METKRKIVSNTDWGVFKSYYVVWKLDPPDEEKKEEFSLNRTM